jgi:hypothetical protein
MDGAEIRASSNLLLIAVVHNNNNYYYYDYYYYYKGKVNLSLCLTNQPLQHEGVWGSGCIDPRFLNLGVSWR